MIVGLDKITPILPPLRARHPRLFHGRVETGKRPGRKAHPEFPILPRDIRKDVHGIPPLLYRRESVQQPAKSEGTPDDGIGTGIPGAPSEGKRVLDNEGATHGDRLSV